MVEEIVDMFEAELIVPEEGGVKKSCTFFVTDNRLVVNVPEGMNPWIGGVAVIVFVASLVGLFLRDINLFLLGLGTGFIVVLLLLLVDFGIRQRKRSRVKKLAPEDILKVGKQNFEIPYVDVVKVKHETVERFEAPSASHVFLPSLPYKEHIYEFETQKGKHVFEIDGRDIGRFNDLLNRFVPEKIEEMETED